MAISEPVLERFQENRAMNGWTELFKGQGDEDKTLSSFKGTEGKQREATLTAEQEVVPL